MPSSSVPAPGCSAPAYGPPPRRRSCPGDTVSMTDGPYAETKEQMGGFWVIDAADLDAALEWARGAATACEGPVELRPMQSE